MTHLRRDSCVPPPHSVLECPEELAAARPVPVAWTVHCGIRDLGELYRASLAPAQGRLAAAGPHLILDLPWGYALTSPFLHEESSLVVTRHPCPEYWEDVWDLGAGSLLVGCPDGGQLASAAEAIRAGQRWRVTPPRRSALRPPERRMLRLVALGWTNERIGLQLDWSEKTVRNKLCHLFAAIGVEDRREAALYYWGLLDRIVPGVVRQT